MAKNHTVDVSDIEAITDAIGKQKVSKHWKSQTKFQFMLICHFLFQFETIRTECCSWIGKQETAIRRFNYTDWGIKNGWQSTKTLWQK